MSIQAKETIKRRMLKNAAAYWGLRETDVAAFDPVVGLLLEAYSHELNKLNHEIEGSRTRILEQMAQLLIPEVYATPQPAHGVVYARPTDAVTKVDPLI